MLKKIITEITIQMLISESLEVNYSLLYSDLLIPKNYSVSNLAL